MNLKGAFRLSPNMLKNGINQETILAQLSVEQLEKREENIVQ